MNELVRPSKSAIEAWQSDSVTRYFRQRLVEERESVRLEMETALLGAGKSRAVDTDSAMSHAGQASGFLTVVALLDILHEETEDAGIPYTQTDDTGEPE